MINKYTIDGKETTLKEFCELHNITDKANIRRAQGRIYRGAKTSKEILNKNNVCNRGINTVWGAFELNKFSNRPMSKDQKEACIRSGIPLPEYMI